MVLHCLADDIGNLVVLTVVHRFHGMQNTTLHRLETILNVWNGALEYYIACIVDKPVLIHAAQLVLGIGIMCVGRFVVRVPCSLFCCEVINGLISVFTHKIVLNLCKYKENCRII